MDIKTIKLIKCPRCGRLVKNLNRHIPQILSRERDHTARRKDISHRGYICFSCGMDFHDDHKAFFEHRKIEIEVNKTWKKTT